MDPVVAKSLVSALVVASVAVFSLLTFKHAILEIVEDFRRAPRTDAEDRRP